MTSLHRFSFLALLCALAVTGCGATEEPPAVESTSVSTGDERDRESAEPAEARGATDPASREPGACDSDGDCREEDDYCGGCHCLTLGPGETAPTCEDPVACFASPCSVTPGRPACLDHRCVRVPDERPSH